MSLSRRLGVTGADADDADDQFDLVPSHTHVDTVDKDVARSLCNYDVCQGWPLERLERERAKLSRIINRIMSRHAGHLHYIQGYHDICSVVLIACDYDERLALAICDRLSRVHLREFLRPSLDVVVEVLNLLFPLLECLDPAVARFLHRANIQSFFALSWVLTWFSHTIYKFDVVVRIFDFLIVSHPTMPLYIAAAFVHQHRGNLLRLECDMPAIHHYFQQQNEVDLDSVLPLARILYRRFPPRDLFRQYRPRIPLDSLLPRSDIGKLYSEGWPPSTKPMSGFHTFPSVYSVNAVPMLLIAVWAIILWQLLHYLTGS
ncbi:hypothetical protein PBRA_006294 [Plasmodiophora brassicae]|uniref:Rab-GAP TBC domain-containing protein n=1 Tax=Plasmodiophora brassicae TaxID=37360 RepID=A0A0G4ISG1_PLABS|nr:hypothetical protein PBRA_006294 [Plasmodiophora brassicae]